MTAIDQRSELARAFWLALLLNFIWINVSEVWRYFQIVRPMLLETFPDQVGIGAVTPGIFVSWMVWDTILILAATGFYWLWLAKFRLGPLHVILSSLCFTVTVFGLIWLGIANMGLAPPRFIWSALPLAWIEQAVAAALTLWSIRRVAQSSGKVGN
ncbi:MAG: hypothetical protein AAF583_14230 [Pseudomonadota bacterium]